MKEMKYIIFGLIGAVFIDGVAFTIFSLASGKYGNLADWVSGLGTLAAFFAVFWQQRKQEEMERAFKIEQNRPRFMFMKRGKLPSETNILLDDSAFYSSLDTKGFSSLKYMVNEPEFCDLITLENISSNIIYTFELIVTCEKEFYWAQNGLQQNSIVAPVPVSLIKELSDCVDSNGFINRDKIPMGASKLKVRFTTSFNETGFYILDLTNGNEEKYYFINETNNSRLQAGKNGIILEKNDKKAKALNNEFDKYKLDNAVPSTIPFWMLKGK